MDQRKVTVGHFQHHFVELLVQQVQQVLMEKMQVQVQSVLVLLELPDHKDQQALQVVTEKMQAQVPSVLVLLEQLGLKAAPLEGGFTD